MNTPICDFVKKYIESAPLRLHMPGHKGLYGFSGDITEIDGADSLYEARGIIRESEKNAGALFGAETFYSAEGASQCIRAMVYLACLHAAENGKKPRILAGRNVHKTFVSAAALLDFEIAWLYGEDGAYLSCKIDVARLETAILREKPTAVYVTSPDYLGNTLDIPALSAVCRRHGVLLLVDNAHGAYRKFLPVSRHPIDGGADICCDSAHKTLPVLTGGAYLHVSLKTSPLFAREAKAALALFGSTSPSYLILEALDRANPLLEKYAAILSPFIREVEAVRERLSDAGYIFLGDEETKLTIHAKKYGYTGTELARILKEHNCHAEFADPDFLVLMTTPETGKEGLSRLAEVLLSVPKKAEITEKPPKCKEAVRVMPPRKALFAPREKVSCAESAGRILATENVGCPPAVPILAAGERIDAAAVEAFSYYGIRHCFVVKE